MRTYVWTLPQEQLEEFERNVWAAIFGTQQIPGGLEKVVSPFIHGGEADLKITKGGVRYFDIPLKLALFPDGTWLVRVYRYLQQTPKKQGSVWAKRAREGYKIMWRIHLEQEEFEVRFSNIPDRITGRPEGRVILKDKGMDSIEAVNKMIDAAPRTTVNQVLFGG